ncbi:MAG: hypothetical protein RQ748_11035, partial [Elusimicrobiales bacterium]|nr:hypothetical protein [Elusimicrobiales bacterium]
MPNLVYPVIFVAITALSVAVVCCAALWLMAPYLMRRAGLRGPADELISAPREFPGKKDILSDFTPGQATAIASMLANETAADIALVVSHMRRETGLELLKALPAGQRAAALLNLAAPQAADPKLLRALKREIEDRLYAAPDGNPSKAAEYLSAMPYRERKDTVSEILALDAGHGAEIRAGVIMEEDLLNMSDDAFSGLASVTAPEDVAPLLPDLPEAIRSRIEAAYTGRSAKTLKKKTAAASGKGRDASLDEFIRMVEKFSAQGLIPKPKPKVK